MRIKTKLNLGVGLLFFLIILLGVVGATYTNVLKKETENILVANYNSLEYTRNMLSVLDEGTEESLNHFEINLQKQEKNITEKGEGTSTSQLRNYYNKFKANPDDKTLLPIMRREIYRIMEANMQAIDKKSELAKKTASTATFWIGITSTLCFLIAFILLINLPSNIANPIKELTNSIKQIAAEKYSERVNFESHNEFGELAKSFNTMAGKLEEYSQSSLAKLMMEKKRIETLINNMHDPVIGLDENLKILFVNEEAINIIGLSKKELVGHYAITLSTTNDLMKLLLKDFTESDSYISSKGKDLPLKIYADGKESYFEKETLHISIVPTGEHHKVLIGHVIILRNVTSYKEQDFAKTNFIATVSHEFKTPISSIKMSLQLLENEQIGTLNSEQKQLLDSIKDDASRLLKITGELLNMTQVESGNIQLAITATDPKEILDYAINATKIQAEQKHVKIEIQGLTKTPQVQADSEKTAWVLTNLISNAIRYSYDNSTIYIDLIEEKDKLVISVKDTGQGILPEYKDKIFNRYYRVPGTNKEGTGLGLSISKEFVEAQGGRISVLSEVGTGSIFSVSLNKVV